MRIVITQKDIDTGIKGNIWHCPIAKALTRAFKKLYVVGGVTYREYLTEERLPLPLKACNFIGDFDNGKSVKPFHFTI
jgi:hypothetical protein